MDIGRSEWLGVDVSTAPSSMGVETLRLHHFLVCEVYELGDLRMPIRKGLGKNDNNEDTCHRLHTGHKVRRSIPRTCMDAAPPLVGASTPQPPGLSPASFRT